jgi:hypothetical protein
VGDSPDVHDDPGIPDSTHVWRRISPNWIKYDSAQERRRPSSQAFQDSRDGTPMSVFLESELSTPAAALQGHTGYSLVALRVGYVRSLGLVVTRSPIRPEDPPGHAWVVGSKTASIRAKLARHATWVVEA